VLVPDAVFADTAMNAFWRGLGPAVTPLPSAFFDAATAEARLAGYFAVKTLDGFGAFTRPTAAAAAPAYVEKTQIGERLPLRRRPPKPPARRC
jgi:DNA mismatch repair protein MutS